MNRLVVLSAALASMMLVSGGPAEAGCIKGAIVGGIAGHLFGHGALGAAAGCAYGASRTHRYDRGGLDRNRGYGDRRYGDERDYRRNTY